MANDQVSLQQYFESLHGREISVADFLKNALCYDETRAYLENNPDIVARVCRATPEGIKQIVEEVVLAVESGSPPAGAESLSQFKPGPQRFAESRPRVSPERAADIVGLTESTIQTRKQKEVDNLKIPERVAAFAKNLRQQQRDELVKSLNNPVSAEDPAEAKREYLERIDRSGAPDKHELKAVAEEIFTQTHLHADAAAEAKKTNDVLRVVVQHVDAPKVFTESFLGKVAEAEDITPAVVAKAERFANIAAAVTTPKIEGFDLGAFVPGTKITPVLEKAVESFSFLQEWGAAKDQILQNAVLSERYKDLIRSGDALVTKLSGERVLYGAESLIMEIFKAPPDQNVLDYLETLRGAGNITMDARQLRDLRDAGGLVKRVITAPPGQDMLSYIETLHGAGITSVDVHQFFVARVYAEHPAMFHFELGASPLDWILRLGEKKAAAGAAETAAATGLKGLFGKLTSEGAKTTGEAFLTKLFPKLAAGTLEALAPGVGWALLAGQVVFSVFPWIVNGIKSVVAPIGALFAAGSAGIIEGFRGSFNLPAAPKSWVDRNTILIILICALGLPVLATITMFAGTMASFPTNVGSSGGWGPNASCDPAVDPACPPAFCDATKQDCSWPVSCGCITQGPFTPGGTHAQANAVDIGVNNSSVCGAPYFDNPPVYATCDGTVGDIHSGETASCWPTCPANLGGNYVVVNCSDGKTQLLYAHLLTIADGVTSGAPIKKGQTIGQADNTGHSSGPHLHYEARGAGGGKVPNITTMLPRGFALGYCWSSK